MSANPTTGVVDDTCPTNIALSNDPCHDLCNRLAKMTMTRRPANLSHLPPELILMILNALKRRRDWYFLARTCRYIAHIVVPELDKSNTREHYNYALWYACVVNNPTILLRQISLDATVVNRHFVRNFVHRRVKYAYGQSMSPLSVAIVAARSDMVELLLANGADANLAGLVPISADSAAGNHMLWYPIHWAVASKHKNSVAIIKILGDHSANLNRVPEECSETKHRHYPQVMKCAPIFRLLMLDKPRCTPEYSEQVTSCEMYNEHFEKLQRLRLRQLKALLEGGANPNKPHGGEFLTPVFFLLTRLAAYTPNFYFSNRLMLSHEEEAQASMVNDIVASLLDTLRDFGANIHGLGNTYTLNQFGMPHRTTAAALETPLHAVCRLNDRHKPLIDWFLRNGTDINVLGDADTTALMAYCDSNFKDTDQFQAFLKRRPVLNHKDKDGRTALHYLCANRVLQPQVMEKAVCMMLDAGADPTALSKANHAPWREMEIPVKKSGGSAEVCNAHDTTLKMLRSAAKAWKKREKKAIERQEENDKQQADNNRSQKENDEQPASADKGARNRGGHTNRRRGSRGSRGAHANDRGGSRAGNREDDKVGQLPSNPTRTRGASHANNRKENREDWPSDERVGHPPQNRTNSRGDYRGGRGHSQSDQDGSIRGRSRNRGKYRAGHQQNTTSRESHNRHSTQEHSTDTRGGSYERTRGGSRGGQRGDARGGVHRGGSRGSGSRGGSSRGNQTARQSRGRGRGGRSRGGDQQGDNQTKPRVET
ncbi:hypothetical protein EKO27_g5221 [Xylaria grammica]|uniref:F-box domain-containing protein n=1 Tax=Xylaria grammica TaxID=363999 RepID=A0A439D659_9PEZI|nr:hypothetical protein EKO27_g5221 [Xylaria grammica]